MSWKCRWGASELPELPRRARTCRGFHSITEFHAQAARLEMRIQGEALGGQDRGSVIVADDVVQRDVAAARLVVACVVGKALLEV